jgi:GNAT superfamily N-acetyltransferase
MFSNEGTMTTKPVHLIDAIQLNLLEAHRLFSGLPGIAYGEGAIDWIVSVQAGPGKQVLRTRFSHTDCEAQIDQALQAIGKYTDHIDWLVFPGCQPSDLGERLLARGLPSSPGGNWMLADLAALPRRSVPDVRVVCVQDAAMLAVWAEVFAAGFGIDAAIYYQAYLRQSLSLDAPKLHYVAFVADQPVCSGTLLCVGGIPGLYDISTPPALRGRGYASALTQYMLADAQRRGYQYAWTWASNMGVPIYQRLGLVQHDFGVREYRWQRGD